MGIKKRAQIKYEQKNKRKKRRLKLEKAGKNPNDYFSSGICISRPIK